MPDGDQQRHGRGISRRDRGQLSRGRPLAEIAAPTMPWDFPGWGTAEKIDDLNVSPVAVSNLGSDLKGKLNVWFATAICGNDITSSCLYVTAIAVLFAGPYAPIALALVAAVLFLFRNIYAEVGTALPLNGGAYNVLLNTTTKFKASLAACLTMLSYTATAVLSADAAMSYLNTLIVHTSLHRLLPHFSVFSSTIIVLCLFALLAIYGIGESAIIALVNFLVPHRHADYIHGGVGLGDSRQLRRAGGQLASSQPGRGRARRFLRLRGGDARHQRV